MWYAIIINQIQKELNDKAKPRAIEGRKANSSIRALNRSYNLLLECLESWAAEYIKCIRWYFMSIQKLTPTILILLCLSMDFCVVRGAIAASFPPMQEALDALISNEAVTVAEVVVPEWETGSDFYFSFEPNASNPTIGFILYPGRNVDPRSYAPFARAIAAEGFLTVIP